MSKSLESVVLLGGDHSDWERRVDEYLNAPGHRLITITVGEQTTAWFEVDNQVVLEHRRQTDYW